MVMRSQIAALAGLLLLVVVTPVAGGPPDAQAPAAVGPAASKPPRLPGLVPMIRQIKSDAGCWPKHRELSQDGNVWCEPQVQQEFGQNLVKYEAEYRDCTKSSAMTMFTCLKVQVGSDGQSAAQCVKCERLSDQQTGYLWLRQRAWNDRKAQGPLQPTRSCTCAARIASRFRFPPAFAGEVFLVPPVVMRGKPSN